MMDDKGLIAPYLVSSLVSLLNQKIKVSSDLKKTLIQLR